MTPAAPTMGPSHPKWAEFLADLGGPKGCDFRKDASGRSTWKCDGTVKRPICRRTLKRYDVDVAGSLKLFVRHGGYCDCEVVFNVDRNVRDNQSRGVRHVAVKFDDRGRSPVKRRRARKGASP